jgi:hypothetical protein
VSLSILLNLKLTRTEPVVISLTAKNGKKVTEKSLDPFIFKNRSNWCQLPLKKRDLELRKGWILAIESLCNELGVILVDIPELEEARKATVNQIARPLEIREKFSSILSANKLDASILRHRFKKRL